MAKKLAVYILSLIQTSVAIGCIHVIFLHSLLGDLWMHAFPVSSDGKCVSFPANDRFLYPVNIRLMNHTLTDPVSFLFFINVRVTVKMTTSPIENDEKRCCSFTPFHLGKFIKYWTLSMRYLRWNFYVVFVYYRASAPTTTQQALPSHSISELSFK